jgi:hypothetical protein
MFEKKKRKSKKKVEALDPAAKSGVDPMNTDEPVDDLGVSNAALDVSDEACVGQTPSSEESTVEAATVESPAEQPEEVESDHESPLPHGEAPSPTLLVSEDNGGRPPLASEVWPRGPLRRDERGSRHYRLRVALQPPMATMLSGDPGDEQAPGSDTPQEAPSEDAVNVDRVRKSPSAAFFFNNPFSAGR